MVVDYTTTSEVNISMYQYLDSLIKNAPQLYKDGVGGATPEPPHLFDTKDSESEGVELWSTREREEYHSLTVQCLYLSKMARPDIQQ